MATKISKDISCDCIEKEDGTNQCNALYLGKSQWVEKCLWHEFHFMHVVLFPHQQHIALPILCQA